MATQTETKTSLFDLSSLTPGVGANAGNCYCWTRGGERYFWTMDVDTLIENRAHDCPYSDEKLDLADLRRAREAGVGVSVRELRRYTEAAERAFGWFMTDNSRLVKEGDFLLGPSVRNVKGRVRYNHDRRGVWARTS